MRIITGTARGARLKTPKGLATRPTADRVKESLFNILGARVIGRRVLDAFAGTGNLGLEALSRGASSAVFVDRATAALIRENAMHTHLDDCAEVLAADVFSVLPRLTAGTPFGLVFCDPPYAQGLWERMLLALDAAADEGTLLTEDAIVVIEHSVTENDIPALTHLTRVRNVRYGKTTQISFFALRAAEETREE